jgi:hypothetical protein
MSGFEEDPVNTDPALCPGRWCGPCGGGCGCPPCACDTCQGRAATAARGAFLPCGGCHELGYAGDDGWVGRYCPKCAPAALELGLDMRARAVQIAALRRSVARLGEDDGSLRQVPQQLPLGPEGEVFACRR